MRAENFIRNGEVTWQKNVHRKHPITAQGRLHRLKMKSSFGQYLQYLLYYLSATLESPGQRAALSAALSHLQNSGNIEHNGKLGKKKKKKKKKKKNGKKERERVLKK